MLMGGVETNRDDQNRPAWSVICPTFKAAGNIECLRTLVRPCRYSG